MKQCEVCGCTAKNPCGGLCGWSGKDGSVCESCERIAEALVDWILDAPHAKWGQLRQLTMRRMGKRVVAVTLTEKGKAARS